MIDLHTHLIPDWDDGARDWEEMRRMAECAHQDGIKKIGLTPHIYKKSKHHDDLAILKERIERFKKESERLPISFYFGAEVYVHHDMIRNIRENNLALNGTCYVFIEFPSEHVPPGAKDLFFNMMLEGYIPIISHPERNSVFRERPGLLYELVRMGCLAQVTGKSVTGEFGQGIRKTTRLFLEHNLVHFIASDAHDPKNRPPVLSPAVEEAGKIIGREKAEAMVTSIPQAILDNREIGDWGEAVNPAGNRKWMVKIPRLLKKLKNGKE